MSFFDEVETTVANTRFLQAQEDTGAIVLPLKPRAQLDDVEASLRPTVSIDLLLQPNTVAQYLFKQYLCTQGDEDAVHLLTAMEQYRKAGGSQRGVLAKKLLHDHPLLAQSLPSPSSGPASAYIVPAPALETRPVAPAHPLAPGSPGSGVRNGASASASAAAAAACSSAATAAAPPCLELVLAAPLCTHPLCSYLASHAAQEIALLQQTLSSCSSSSSAPPLDLLDPLQSRLSMRLAERAGGFIASSFYDRLVQLTEYAAREVSLASFRVFRVLGRGAFGAVSAVQRIDTHAIYAMKEMGKRQVKADQSEWMVINECKVLSHMSSPFVLGLKYSFHEGDTLSMVFDMCSGGDLKFHLRAAKDRCFDPERARFYASEVLLGLEHLHSQDTVYRDLKPNNILLNTAGHVVISDLGLTIKLRRHKLLRHLGGTVGYWAPEIVSKAGTYKSSDYWSYGVMLYEMLTGKRPECVCAKKSKEWCPFGNRRSHEENALDPEGVLRVEVVYPEDKIEPQARDLLRLLLEPDPLKRLGGAGGLEDCEGGAAMGSGIAALKAHPYFAAVDWEALAALEVVPPYVPDSRSVNANSIGEVGEFSKAPFKHIALTPDDHKLYDGFRFTSAPGVQRELLDALAKIDHPDSLNNPANESKDEADGSCCTIL